MSRRADRRARRSTDRSGFTLVEVLVAFVVMTTILSVLYHSTVQTRAGAIGFSDRVQEEAVALSLLAEFRARRELRDGRYAGDRDGRRWTLLANRIDLTDQLPTRLGPAHEIDRHGAGKDDTAKSETPVWEMQRLVLQVATEGRPLEVEALHLVRLTPPDPEAR